MSAELLATPTARVLVVLDPAQPGLHDQGAVWMFVDALGRLVGFFRRFTRRRSTPTLARFQVTGLALDRFRSFCAIRVADTFEDAPNQSGLYAGAARRRTLRPARGEPFRCTRRRSARLLGRRPRVVTVARR